MFHTFLVNASEQMHSHSRRASSYVRAASQYLVRLAKKAAPRRSEIIKAGKQGEAGAPITVLLPRIVHSANTSRHPAASHNMLL